MLFGKTSSKSLIPPEWVAGWSFSVGRRQRMPCLIKVIVRAVFGSRSPGMGGKTNTPGTLVNPILERSNMRIIPSSQFVHFIKEGWHGEWPTRATRATSSTALSAPSLLTQVGVSKIETPLPATGWMGRLAGNGVEVALASIAHSPQGSSCAMGIRWDRIPPETPRVAGAREAPDSDKA